MCTGSPLHTTPAQRRHPWGGPRLRDALPRRRPGARAPAPAPGHAAARHQRRRPPHDRPRRAPARHRRGGHRAGRHAPPHPAEPRGRGARVVGFRELRASAPRRTSAPRAATTPARPPAERAAGVQVVARAERGQQRARGQRRVERRAASRAGSRGASRTARRPAAVALARARRRPAGRRGAPAGRGSLAERLQALGGGRARAERRRAGDQRVLELARVLVEQREREPGAVAEAAVERAGADAGGAGDVLHRDVLDPALVDQRRAAASRMRRRLRAASARSRGGGPSAISGRSGTPAIMPTARPERAPPGTGRRAGRPGARSARGRRATSSSSNAPSAMPTGSSDSSTCAPEALSALRTSACAQTAPKRPVLAPITADGLLPEDVVRERARRPVERVLEPAGERGVVLGRGDQQRVGRLDRVQEVLHRRGRVVLEVLVEDGQGRRGRPTPRARPRAAAESPAARSSRRLWEPRRRLPAMPRIRMALRPAADEREVDGQRDLVGERLAAGGQRRCSSSCRTRCGR